MMMVYFEFYKKNKKLACKEKNLHNHLKKLYPISKFTHFFVDFVGAISHFIKKSAAHAVSRD